MHTENGGIISFLEKKEKEKEGNRNERSAPSNYSGV